MINTSFPEPWENATKHCALAAPTAENYFKKLTWEYEIYIITSLVFCSAIIVLFIGKLFFIFHYVSSYRRAGFMIWLAGIFPITAVVCTVSICVPRAMAISNMFIFLYFARSLFTFVELVIDYFGGRIEMAKELQGNTVKMNIPPCCCCCPCLPPMKPSPQNLRRLGIYVYQTAIINPGIYFISAVIWTDQIGVADNSNKSPLKTYAVPVLSLLSFASTMTAMYGTNLYARMSAGALKGYCLITQVRFMQILLLLFNLQNYIFTLVASKDVIKCDMVLSANSKAAMYDRFALLIEIFVLSMASAFFFRPSINSTFDLHPARSSFRQRKPAFSFSDPRPLRRVRGSIAAESIDDEHFRTTSTSSYYYYNNPEPTATDEIEAPRKRTKSSNSNGYFQTRKVTPMPIVSTSSSPGVLHSSNSAPDAEALKKKRNRSRIPDSIMETDEDEFEEQQHSSDAREKKIRNKKRMEDWYALDDDVFVETDEKEDSAKDGLRLNVGKLGRFYQGDKPEKIV